MAHGTAATRRLGWLLLVAAFLAVAFVRAQDDGPTCNGEPVNPLCVKQCCPDSPDSCEANVDFKPKLCPAQGKVQCVCAANVTKEEFANVVFVNEGVQTFS